MTNAKKENVSEKASSKKGIKVTLNEQEQNSKELVLARLKGIQSQIRASKYDTRKHVIRDLESAIAFLRVIQDNPEIIELSVKAVEKSILSIPTDHAS